MNLSDPIHSLFKEGTDSVSMCQLEKFPIVVHVCIIEASLRHWHPLVNKGYALTEIISKIN